jgi:hypothetical protein
MKKMQKSFFALAALVLCAGNVVASNSSSCGSTPLLVPRSTHKNVARDIVGWEEYINLCDKDCFSGALGLTIEFDQTFRSGRLARCLLGADVSNVATNLATTTTNNCGSNSNCGNNSDCNRAVLAIAGSQVCDTDRPANAWLADYFGLPTDFSSTISLSPRIRNITGDIAFYFGLDEWVCGSYFRLDLPITNTRWALRYNETVIDPGINDYPAGYFAPDLVPRADLLDGATAFLTGASAPTLGDGVIFDNLTAAKWAAANCNCKGLSLTRLAAVTGELGWNFVCCDDYHFGLNIYAAAPTGNRPTGEFFFEPIVGNGHHWELGGGVSAHAVLWRGCESDATFNVYLEGNVEHLFKSCQTRVFDLKGKANSRYMLAQKLGDVTDGLAGNDDTTGIATSPTPATAQFANEFAPVANLTSSKVDVKVAVQGDVAIKLAYGNGCGFTWDIGYEFWGRSCEKICRKTGCNAVDPLADGATWALKGDAMVFGFCPTTDNTAIPLGATESLATIHGGTNDFCTSGDANATTSWDRNPSIDNAQFAVATCPLTTGANIPVLFSPDDAIGSAATTQTRTSIDPVFLSDADVDLAGTKGISNKIFTHLSYAWLDCEDWTPFLGIGVSAEFAQNNCGDCNGSNDCTSTSTSTTSASCCSSSDSTSCHECAISQWGVWVKGGFTFN